MVRKLGDRLSGFFGKSKGVAGDPEILLDYCQGCGTGLLDSELYLRIRVCHECRLHYPLTARDRILLIADTGTFRETHRSIVSLKSDRESRSLPRRKRVSETNIRTGFTESVVTGRCNVGGVPAIVISLDLKFLGGSLGGVIGEKVTRAFEMARRRKETVFAIVTSGTEEIQEGVLSLMQMAKVSFAIGALANEGVPFICLIANPTVGQVYASFASLADIILAEPGAVFGLAPTKPNVEAPHKSRGTAFYSSEAQLHRGMADCVVDRENTRAMASEILAILNPATSNKAKIGEEKFDTQDRSIYQNRNEELNELWPAEWSGVALAKQSESPTSLDFINGTLSRFVELHGDRLSGDDRSIVSGFGYLGDYSVAVLGQERGHDLTSKERHDGRTYPEGYRKAQRIMRLAAKYGLPLITFVDTPGPYYGSESEEKGIGGAIGESMVLMAQIPIPTISVIVGQGGSEGALALSLSDKTLMMENAVYLVTSPENAAVSLYKGTTIEESNYSTIRLTAKGCMDLGIVDRVVYEPKEGAHRNPHAAILTLKKVLETEVETLKQQSRKRLVSDRYKKFRRMVEYSSDFRLALDNEVAHLQGYVAQGVRLINKGSREVRRQVRRTRNKGKS